MALSKKLMIVSRLREHLKSFMDQVDTSDLQWLVEYLASYGWIRGVVADVGVIRAAIRTLQNTMNMVPSGLPDRQTMKVLRHSRRCGCVDVEYQVKAEAIVRGWRKSNPGKPLTYHIGQFLPGISKHAQRELWKETAAAWSGVADLHFAETMNAGDANIVILAGPQQANDGLGSPGNVLAYAYLPPTANFTGQLSMVMDDVERWGDDVQFLPVARHEWGHLLGLNHSQNPKALMKPFYDPAIGQPTAYDDIPRIQAIYGKAIHGNPSNPTGPTNPAIPLLGPEHLTDAGRRVVRQW